DRAARGPAGLQADGLRQVPLPRAEEGARGEAQAEADPGQGDQVPARDRRGRLQDQAQQADPVPRGGRQGQGDVALSRPRDGAQGVRRAAARAGEEGPGSSRLGRAVSEARGPADGDGARAEEESPGGQGATSRCSSTGSKAESGAQEGSLGEDRLTAGTSDRRGFKCLRRLKEAQLQAARRQAKTRSSFMPKMKSKRGAAKRFNVRGSGSIKRAGAYKRHILTKKSTKRKRHMRRR